MQKSSWEATLAIFLWAVESVDEEVALAASEEAVAVDASVETEPAGTEVESNA